MKNLKTTWAIGEELQRKWDEEQRLRDEAARLQADENKRIENLEKQVSTWELAASIRRFIEAVREEATRRNSRIEEGSPLDQWIRWAERHANTIDPVGSVLAGAGPTEKGG